MLGHCEHVMRHVAREGLGSGKPLSSWYAAAVFTKRTSRMCSTSSNSCANSSSLLRVAFPDSWAGARSKRQTVQMFPFWVVILVPGQQNEPFFSGVEVVNCFSSGTVGTHGLACEIDLLKTISEVQGSIAGGDCDDACDGADVGNLFLAGGLLDRGSERYGDSVNTVSETAGGLSSPLRGCCENSGEFHVPVPVDQGVEVGDLLRGRRRRFRRKCPTSLTGRTRSSSPIVH